MKLFRNRDVKIELITQLIVLVVGTIIFMSISVPVGLLFMALIAVIMGVSFFCAVDRSKRLGLLSEKIDFLLHNEQTVFIAEHEEGELSILQSEILKMTKRMQEHADALKEDKIKLTHAIEDIFHQLRTPLTSMALSVSMLSEEELSYEERVRLARDIKKQISRATWLVETLLKMSKIDAGTAAFKKEPVLVSAMLTEASESLLIPLELRDIELRLNIKDEKYQGDIKWSAEAIGNILKNCMEHTPAGGAITVDVSENALYTEIDISDNGEGFSKEDIPHLFERFYKGKNSSKESYGIGLALTKMIIASQNGTIKAAHEAGGGARFEIKFYKSIV